MTTYTMTQVETLTGISAHTLRAWERRYSFLVPSRSETNIRYYTDAELKNLINIGILVRNGHRISKIDRMDQEEIHFLVNQILTTHSDQHSDRINGLVLSMLKMDEDAFNKIYSIAVIDSGLIATITKLIYPFLNLVGGLWTTNKIIPAQEHFISNLIRQKIISAIDALPSPPENAKQILLFLLEGESHEIGLLLSYYIAKKLGWRVYYLGQDVPSVNIKDVFKIVKPDLMLTMFVTPRSQNISKIIARMTKDNDIPLLISGAPLLFEKEMKLKKTIYIKSPHDFEAYLNSISSKKSDKI